LHFNVRPDAFSAQLAKLASPHCPPDGAMINRALVGRPSEETAKDPAFPFTATFTRPGVAADLSWMTTL
jgi:hypothetical protein